MIFLEKAPLSVAEIGIKEGHFDDNSRYLLRKMA